MSTEQMKWHRKPKGALLCPVCGCDNVRAGVLHRALAFGQARLRGALWEKRVKVCFGLDTSVEGIRPKGWTS